MASPFDDYEVVGTYKPPAKSSQSLFKDFEYVADIPTVSGQFQEGVTRFLRDVGTSAVAVPLKGASIFETFREKIVDEKLREEIDRQFERAQNPIRPNDRTLATRDLRRIANLYLGKNERKELWDIANKLEKGEVEVPELEREAKEKLPFYVPPKMPSERGAYKAGERVEQFLKEKLPTTPGYEDTLGVQVGGALGSTAGSIAQSLVGGPVTLLAGSALQGIEEQYERATKAGLKGQEAVDYAIQGSGPGALGMLSTEYILRKVPKAVRQKMLQHLTDIGVTGTAEAMMEATQEAIQNAIEMQYNKDMDVLDGTPFAAGMGFTAGAILRGIVLGATRGRGVSGGANGGEVDPVSVQRELAAEELRIRQEGTADAETHEPGKESPKAKSPLEAAQKGEIKETGRPVNVVHNGQRYNGYIRSETPDGGYEIVDQDGVVSVLEPGEAVVKDGWRERKSDEDIEKTLKEWLEGEIPWVKVTVTDPEGTAFKAIEGPPVGNQHIFKDAYGKTHKFDADTVNVSEDWDAEAEDEPLPTLGEVAKAQEKVEPITEEDRASPLPTDLIAEGRRATAEGEGAQKANTILAKAGIPPIGTEVMVGGEKFIIQDASDDTVEILNSAGVINRRNIGEIAPEIAPIPAKEAAKPGVERTAPRTSVPEGAETDIPLPAFIGPKGRRVLTEPQTEPTEKPGEAVPEVKITAAPEARIETPKGVVVPKEDITVAGEARTGTPPITDIQPPAFLSEPRTGKPPTTPIPEAKVERPVERTTPRTDIPSGAVKDDQREREESRIGIGGRESPGDQAEYRQGEAGTAQARVRDTEKQGTKEQIDVGQNEGQVPEEGARPEPAGEVREAEVWERTGRRESVRENEPDQGQGARVRQETIGEGGKGPGVPQPKEQPPQPAPSPIPEGTQRTAARWWDEQSEEDRRTTLRRSGYSEPEQRKEYVGQSWDSLPEQTKTRLLIRNGSAISSYAGSTKDRTVRRATATTVTGRQVPVRYKIIESDDLITSQDTQGRLDKRYPAELQPRDRTRAVSLDQINRISANIRPDWLDQSPKTSDGAPIVGPDNAVESGNARTIAIKKAYEEGRGDNYREYLKSQGYPIEGMKNPVLVRVRENDLSTQDRVTFAKESNVSDTLGMSATERALSDAGSMPDDILDLYRVGEIASGANRPFVREFIRSVVAQNEQGDLISSSGELSKGAVRRIEAALLAKAYQDSSIIEELSESTDSSIRSIGNALIQVAPDWAKMRFAASDGRIDPSMDQTERLVEAVKLVQRARTDERNIAEFVNQKDMFTGKGIHPVSEAFLRLMFRDTRQWTKPVGTERLADSLRLYATESMKTTPGIDLLGQAAPEPESVLSVAKERQYGEKKPEQARLTPRKDEEVAEPDGGVESRVSEPSKTRERPKPKTSEDDRTKQPESRIKDVEKEISVADAKAQGIRFRKNGNPFGSPEDAMRIFSTRTHEPVKVEGGWGVREKAKAQPTPEPAPVTKQAEPKVRPLKQEIPYVKQNDVYLNKDGRGWSRKADASSVARKLGKGFTVTEDDSGKIRGWIVKAKPEVKPEPETKVEKAKPASARRVTKKEYEAKRAAVSAALRSELDKMGLKDVDLSTPDKLGDVEGSKSIDDSKIAVGRSRSNLVEVALSPERDYRKTLRHEAVHAMRNLGLFKDAEWRTLEREAKADKELIADVKERYAGESLTDEAILEEAIADKFADYDDGIVSPKGFVRSAFEKIKKFIKALGNALRGNGFRTASDVFQSIESGEIGARPRGAVTRLETKSQIARAEQAADDALRELNDPSSGLVDERMASKLREVDAFFVDDIGTIRKKAITPRTIASFDPDFAPVYGTAKHQAAFRDYIVSELGNTYKPYQQLKRNSKNKVNKVLELGRLNSRVYKPESDGTITVRADKQTENMKAGESVTLNAEEVKAYQSVRSMMDMALGFFRDQTVRDFGFDHTKIKTPKDALALIGPKTPPSVRDKIQTLAKMMTDIQQSERTGYVPFTRFGNIVVTAKRINPNTGQYETLHSETVEVQGFSGWGKRLRRSFNPRWVPKDIQAVKDKLAKRYPGADIKAFEVASRADNRPDTDKDMLTELLQLPPDKVAAAVQKMHKDALSKGFRKHFFGAKNVPGYSGDIERSIADYVIGISGYIARRESHQQWENAIEAIPNNKPRLKAYARNYREYFNSPGEDWAHLRQAGFIYYLAGNLSNAALNLTQVPMVTVPYLSMFGNEARVSFEVSRAYKDALQMVGGSFKDQFNPNKAPADVRADLKKAWEENVFTPLAMFDIMGTAYNRNENIRSLSHKARDVVNYLAIPQTSTERFNRLVTYIAAHRLANRDPAAFRQKAFNVLKGNALAADTVLTKFSVDAFARHAVDETQYDMGKINRAEFFRGPGAAILQFKGFVANTLELHYKLGTIHGAQGKKALGMMQLGLMLAAGALGYPLIQDAIDFTEMVYKWLKGQDLDIRTELREIMVELTGSPQIAQLITNGSTRALGLDMTDRIGLGKVFPRTTLEAGGVPASLLFGQGLRAGGHLREGNIEGALREFSPSFAKNPQTAMQWHNEGIRTMYGDPVFTPDEVTAGDIAAKTLGFTPSKVAERRAMEWAQQRAGKATQDLKTKYYRKMARAIIDMNNADSDAEFLKVQDKFMSIIDEIQAHNDRAIDGERYHEIIEIDNRALERRVMAEITGRGAVREQTAPKVARPRMQELREIYGANP